MFERIAQTEAEKDAEAAEGRTPDQIASLRLGAILLLAKVCLTIAAAVALRVWQLPILQMAIALGLAFYLYRLRPRAEALALGLAILASVLPLLALTTQSLLLVLVQAVPTWGLSVALLLLLTGDPKRARRAVAIGLFCVFTVGMNLLIVALILSRRP